MNIKYAFILAIAFIVASCANTKGLYYWGDYSDTLYEYKQTPNKENLEKHKLEILNIISKSKELNKKVPPGICCEYGYILAKEGKKEEAKKYFALEIQAYPEVEEFIKKLYLNL